MNVEDLLEEAIKNLKELQEQDLTGLSIIDKERIRIAKESFEAEIELYTEMLDQKKYNGFD